MIDARPFVFAAALLASPAAAQEVDGVIATGPAASAAAPMTTDQKIANILAAAKQQDETGQTVEAGPRKIHGEAGVAVGSDGYRSAYVQTVIPVGESGTVAMAYSQSQGGRGYGYGPGFGDLGYGGPGYGGHGYGARRDGTAKSLGLAFDFDTSKSAGADQCAAAFRDGRRPVEPLWATEIRGRSSCEAPRAD
jgi:hypothetical protein